MRLFKKKGLNYPPPEENTAKGAEEGFSLAEAPEDFTVQELLSEAQIGEDRYVLQSLNDYHAQWSRYAVDRNLYNDQSLRDMWSAVLEADVLASKVSKSLVEERQELVDSLREKLEEIKGTRAEEIVRRAAEHQTWLEKKREATHKEHTEGLAETVHQFGQRSPIVASEELGDSKIRSELELTEDQIYREPSERQKKADASVANEKQAADASEEVFLKAYKEFYSQKGSTESAEPQELKALKRKYLESRVAYADALTKSASDRLNTRGVKSGVLGGKNYQYDTPAVLSRYNRLIRYKEVIKAATEKQYQARLDALDARGKGIFRKSLDWAVGKNEKLEKSWGKQGARLVRAFAVTTVVGGVGAALGTVGAVGALGFAGWGAARIAKSLLINSPLAGLAGMATGEIAGFGFKALQKKAAGELAYEGRDTRPLSIEDLLLIDANRIPLEKSAHERTLQQRKMVARVIGALVAGAGISAFEQLGEAAVSQATPEAVSGTNPPIPPSAPTGAESPGGAAHVAEPEAREPQVTKVSDVKARIPISPHQAVAETQSAPVPEAQPIIEQPETQAKAVPEQLPGDAPLPIAPDQNNSETAAYQDGAYTPSALGTQPAEPETVADVPDAPQASEPANSLETQTSEPANPPSLEAVQGPETIATESANTEPSEPQSVEQPPASPDVIDRTNETAPPPIETSAAAGEESTSLDESRTAVTTPNGQVDSVPTEQPTVLLNPNGFDLSRTAVGVDPKGNAFVHLVSTGDMEKDNDASYDAALKFAQTHQQTPVYFTQQTQGFFGNKSVTVFALKYNEGSMNWNYRPSEMPSIPTETDYKPIT